MAENELSKFSQHSLTSEANTGSSSEEVLCFLWNLKFYYRVHKRIIVMRSEVKRTVIYGIALHYSIRLLSFCLHFKAMKFWKDKSILQVFFLVFLYNVVHVLQNITII